MNIMEEKKYHAENWFKALRDQFCDSLSAIEGALFERKSGNTRALGEEK